MTLSRGAEAEVSPFAGAGVFLSLPRRARAFYIYDETRVAFRARARAKLLSLLLRARGRELVLGRREEWELVLGASASLRFGLIFGMA